MGIRCILQVGINDLAQIKAATSGDCQEGSGEAILEWRVAKLTDALLGWLLGVSVLKMHSLIETRAVGLLRVNCSLIALPPREWLNGAACRRV